MIYFIGEKRSEQAIRNNWHWDDNVSTAKFLLDCLKEIGLEQKDILFRNLWHDNGDINYYVIDEIKMVSIPVVGMGDIVCKELNKQEIRHTKIIHPAARGRIRKKERYTQHLKEKLGWIITTEEILEKYDEVWRELAKL